jgi:hypothetical protein
MWKTTLSASSTMVACQARFFRRRRACDSSSSIRPMMTSAVRLMLVSVPGVISVSRCRRRSYSPGLAPSIT